MGGLAPEGPPPPVGQARPRRQKTVKTVKIVRMHNCRSKNSLLTLCGQGAASSMVNWLPPAPPWAPLCGFGLISSGLL